MADTSYIDDECEWRELASNTDRHILLIHPDETEIIYIHVKEQKHGKVDLNQLNIPNGAWLLRIDLIGQLLILGNWKNHKLYMCELIVTESDASIKLGCEREPIESRRGQVAAVSHCRGDEQLHLFAARRDVDTDCTEISEYKFNLSVSSSDLNQLPMQTLEAKERFYPYCLLNLNSYSSVLIGRNYVSGCGRLTAVELPKHHVNYQLSCTQWNFTDQK